MGQEIQAQSFHRKDFAHFEQQLKQETAQLQQFFQSMRFVKTPSPRMGVELEAWIIDSQGQPMPINQTLIEALGSEMACPELARFILELNSPVLEWSDHPFTALHQQLQHLWQQAQTAANTLDCQLVLIGILPSVGPEHLSLANMSPWHRYRLLNQQLLRLRQGQPFPIEIHGHEHLQIHMESVMAEAMATSLQIHWQLDPRRAHHTYNAAQLIAPIMLAVGANSPFLLQKQLWAESRIALFEQAVATLPDSPSRVLLGHGYLQQSLFELFAQNVSDFPVLIPVDLAQEEPDLFAHVNLHNGTIWRWNRPIIGQNANGEWHLRLEHRVLPAGPSLVDMVANLALYCGLLHYFSQQDSTWCERLAFHQLQRNFYQAARLGMDCKLMWLDGKPHSLNTLMHEKQLLNYAAEGLRQLGASEHDFQPFLQIIHERLSVGQNGARWLTRYYQHKQPDFNQLSCQYALLQQSNQPVHRWPV